MFSMILFSFLTIVISISYQTNNLVNILELKDNLFHTVNENVHSIMNNIFAALKIKPNFMKSTKIQLLLTMHSDLNNIAVKNFNVYKEITKMTKSENNSYTNNLDLTNIIDQIIKESSNGQGEIYIKETKIDNNTVASNSIESLDFLKDFLQKINGLTVNNFTIDRSNETLNNETDILELESKYHLKLWSPPSVNEREELFNKLTRRIYKGKRTKIKKYPFVASVHVMKEFMCAGSIISKDFVITAASCLQIVYNNKRLRENPASVFIRVGSDYTKRFGETIPISEMHFHPQYESFSLKNNLVLLRMGKQLKALKKKRRIRRIQYDKTAASLRDVNEVTILGWGATDNILEVKTYQPLAVADIDVYNFEKCQEVYSATYVTDTNFCLGFVSKGGGACNKDVGGPGVVNGVLMGVISFGPPVCGAPNMPTVLVKLGFYADWIENIIKQNPPTTKLTQLRTLAQINIKEFPTTSTQYEDNDEEYPQNPNYARTGLQKDFPEEVAILNQILNDVILSNKSIIDDILYGALEDDISDIFKPSTKIKLHHHPLVNKSLFLLPDVHDFGKEHQNVTVTLTTSSPSLTTSHPGFNVDYLDDYEERLRYLDTAYHLMTVLTPSPTRTTTITEEPYHITDRYGRTRNITLLELADTESEYSKVVSSEDSEAVSGNYEANSKENEGLSIDAEGMSQIEESDKQSNTERLQNTDLSADRNINQPNIKGKTEVLIKPHLSKSVRKVTRLIMENKLYASDIENYRSKIQKKVHHRFNFKK